MSTLHFYITVEILYYTMVENTSFLLIIILENTSFLLVVILNFHKVYKFDYFV